MIIYSIYLSKSSLICFNFSNLASLFLWWRGVCSVVWTSWSSLSSSTIKSTTEFISLFISCFFYFFIFSSLSNLFLGWRRAVCVIIMSSYSVFSISLLTSLSLAYIIVSLSSLSLAYLIVSASSNSTSILNGFNLPITSTSFE